MNSSINWPRVRMAATIRGILLQYLIITVVILANGKWSFCGSTHSGLEGRAIAAMGQATSMRGFNLVSTGASSSILPTHYKIRRRLLSLEQNENFYTIEASKEVEILMAFKSEITGDPLRVLSSWRANDTDPCRWTGVQCSANSDYVTAINLEGLNLVGTVSTLLSQLLNLQHLDLSQNLLHGSIPASLGSCSNLLYLNMSFNGLHGNIPPSVGNLHKLQTLDLFSNNLTGVIPEALGNCSALQYLALGTNFLDGPIPSQLGALSNLKYLSLAVNSLSGSVPPSLGNCSSLTQLWLRYNQGLGRELPFQLQELIHLRSFHVEGCSFQGNFPKWTLNMTSLQELGVGENQLTGNLPQSWRQLQNLSKLVLRSNPWNPSEIPRDIGALTNLEHFDIGNCGVVGKIPRSLFNLSSLRNLELFENQLTGPISNEIGSLRNLYILYLDSNAFSGELPWDSLSNCSVLQVLGLGLNPGFVSQAVPSSIGSFQKLQRVFLAEMNLQGPIPIEIGQLSQLTEFTVYSNNFSRAIPASVGNCTFLKIFDPSYNQLTGQVPPVLGNLSQLSSLNIAGNFFDSGPLPTFIFNQTASLVYIQVQDNQFNGKLDGDFGAFQLLQYFDASNNDFHGPIPESLSNCSTLVILALGQNTLTGEIPLGLANLTSLVGLHLEANQLHGSIDGELLRNYYVMQDLDFSDNNFDGTIPVEIGQLVYLQQLNLSTNKLTGALPDSLGKCMQLISVDFSHNRLTSSIRGEAFGTMNSLKMLNLSGNLLSGSWPSQISGLKQIVVINISANNISGPIPLGLGGCLSLQSLDVSLNRFSGPIPRDLGLLKDLTTFNASYNNFSGPIPNSGAFQANLTSASFLGNPGLCGGILGPQRLCPVEITASPKGRSHCNGFECPIVWISVVSAVVFVIILLGALYISSRHYHGREDNRDLGLVTFTIDPSMRFFSKFDILAAVGAGEEAAIGKGPQSIVYKANLPGGEYIAIKVLKDRGSSNIEGRRQDAKAILSEAHTLAQLRHRNIINIVGLYSSEDIKAILLEYMPKGSLHENLHGNAPCELTWAERFKILLGVTKGMVYLHHEFPDPIIHRDLKPSNILLDADLEPKLCDFGISKFVTYNNGDNGEVSASTICGTFGYMAPEYGTGTRVSTKGDVYSFGVVLLELLTGKAVIQTQSMPHSGQDEGLVYIVQSSFQESNITPRVTPIEVLDPTLKFEGARDAIIRQQMMLTLQLGLFCASVLPENRPTMNVVLEFMLEIENLGQGPISQRTLDDLLKEECVAPSC